MGEDTGGGDGVVSLGGGGIVDSVDLPASGSFSNSGRSPLSLFRSDTIAAPAGTASRATTGVADDAKFGDICRISSIDPMSSLPLGATELSFCALSPSGCTGAEGAAALLLSSLDARCCNVGVRVRNVTLRLSRLSVNMGRYCDCGLNPEVAFRLVFSRMVRISCCIRRSVTPSASYETTKTDRRGRTECKNVPLPCVAAAQCV